MSAYAAVGLTHSQNLGFGIKGYQQGYNQGVKVIKFAKLVSTSEVMFHCLKEAQLLHKLQ